MLYIHQSSCISPQDGLDSPKRPVDNFLTVVEPRYEGIPANVLRRMSKSVRMGTGAAFPLLGFSPDGILIGTGYGGMTDSIRFLHQIVDYDEGQLAPGTFVQSTANAIASQLGLVDHHHGYNITFVSRGLAFESALLDAAMLVREHPGSRYLVGGVDEISNHQHRFESAEGWYKKEPLAAKDFYAPDLPGSIAGEGAAIFLVDGERDDAVAAIREIVLLGGEEEEPVRAAMTALLGRHLPQGEKLDWLISGENGDCRAHKWSEMAESVADAGVIRYKHLCGEYPTAAAYALWLACHLPVSPPPHLVKGPGKGDPHHLLLYNNYQFTQHSLILLERFP
jgi:hypothetical protein